METVFSGKILGKKNVASLHLLLLLLFAVLSRKPATTTTTKMMRRVLSIVPTFSATAVVYRVSAVRMRSKSPPSSLLQNR